MPRRALGSLSVLAVWLRNACATRNTPTVPDSDCASPVETKHGGVMTCVQTYSVSRPHAFFRTAARQLFAFAYGRLTEVVAQVIGKEEHQHANPRRQAAVQQKRQAQHPATLAPCPAPRRPQRRACGRAPGLPPAGQRPLAPDDLSRCRMDSTIRTPPPFLEFRSFTAAILNSGNLSFPEGRPRRLPWHRVHRWRRTDRESVWQACARIGVAAWCRAKLCSRYIAARSEIGRRIAPCAALRAAHHRNGAYG